MVTHFYIFRNSTVELFFSALNASYSGYNEISHIPDDADRYIWAYLPPVKTDIIKFVLEIETFAQQLQFVLSKIKPQKACYAFTMYNMYYLYHETGNYVINSAIEKYNDNLYALAHTHHHLKIIDFSHFCRHYPLQSLIDWKYYYLSQIQLNPKLSSDFHCWLQNEIDAIEGKRKKCLVLDLDNTLWGGILGEDGIEGIQIGNTYPGSAFLDFQNNLLELAKNGVLLTICSKNNEQDVLEAWEKNPFLQIRKEQLAAWRISWQNKAEMIVSLANELNIGLDSMVLIDDNPAERALVKQIYPLVEAPDFPKQPYLLPAFFEKICTNYFQSYKLTDEDKTQLEHYKANAERLSFQQSFVAFDDYLKSLHIELTIHTLNTINLPRIAQLTQKTNQFNLTTKRYTDEELQKFLVYCLDVKDKFGDNGITGVVIVSTDIKAEIAYIDNFLLSCRILGKQIETVFLKFVLNKLKVSGFSTIYASYIPTLKNAQVSDFYDSHGFKLDETDLNGTKHYRCSMQELDLTIPEIYKINTT